MMCQCVGGPLDGENIEVSDDSENKFTVLPCVRVKESMVVALDLEEATVFACYQCQDGKLVFRSSKTKEQMRHKTQTQSA